MAPNREWLENWLTSRPKLRQDRPSEPAPETVDKRKGHHDDQAAREEVAGDRVPGHLLANLSPAGQRRLLTLLQQNDVPGATRFVAFRAEPFREKDLLDSFEALIKSPTRRTQARYVPQGADSDQPQE